MSGDIQGLINDFQRETKVFKGDFKMKTSNLASRGSLSISKAAAEMHNQIDLDSNRGNYSYRKGSRKRRDTTIDSENDGES